MGRLRLAMGKGWVQSFPNDTLMGPQLSLLRANVLEGMAFSWFFQYAVRLRTIQRRQPLNPLPGPRRIGLKQRAPSMLCDLREGTFLLFPLQENEGKVP